MIDSRYVNNWFGANSLAVSRWIWVYQLYTRRQTRRSSDALREVVWCTLRLMFIQLLLWQCIEAAGLNLVRPDEVRQPLDVAVFRGRSDVSESGASRPCVHHRSWTVLLRLWSEDEACQNLLRPSLSGRTAVLAVVAVERSAAVTVAVSPFSLPYILVMCDL